MEKIKNNWTETITEIIKKGQEKQERYERLQRSDKYIRKSVNEINRWYLKNATIWQLKKQIADIEKSMKFFSTKMEYEKDPQVLKLIKNSKKESFDWISKFNKKIGEIKI